MRWLEGISDAMNMNLDKLQEMTTDREAWHAAVHGSQRVRHNWVTEGQQSWGRCYAERFLYVALTEFYAGIQRG